MALLLVWATWKPDKDLVEWYPEYTSFLFRQISSPIRFTPCPWKQLGEGCSHNHSLKLESPLSTSKCHIAAQGWNLCLHSDFTLKQHPLAPSMRTIPFFCFGFLAFIGSLQTSFLLYRLSLKQTLPFPSRCKQWFSYSVAGQYLNWQEGGCFKGQIIFCLFSSNLAHTQPRLLLKCRRFLLLLLFLVEFKLQW